MGRLWLCPSARASKTDSALNLSSDVESVILLAGQSDEVEDEESSFGLALF